MSRNLAVSGLLVGAAVSLTAGLTKGTGCASGPSIQAARGPAVSSAPLLHAASFRFKDQDAAEPRSEAGPPIRLTASDGTGLSLVALEANGVLEPPLAFTELHLTFENPRPETIEGRFRIALPPGAALSRFAMKLDNGWQEGEVVERQRARQAYEDFLHRRQDPALLEQEAGNEFSARVFPISARGRKELIVSYSHAMPRPDEPYAIPLRGLSQIGRLDIRVLLGERAAAGAPASSLGGEVSERRMVELHKQDWTPDRDFAIAQDRVASRAGLRHANLAVVRVSPPIEAVPQEIGGLYVLVDSSASRALGYAAEARRLSELVEGLRAGSGGATPLGIAAFDQEAVPLFEGRADTFDAAAARRLAGRRPLGASDLEKALGWLAERLAKSREGYPRVLLITDGVATAGNIETRALRAAVHALGAHGVERLDALAVGGLRDAAVLRELTTGNLAQDGQQIDGDAPPAEIARRLTLACRSGIRVTVDGAAWVWPETLDGMQPGDAALVYADVPPDRPLRVTLDGQPVSLGAEPAAAERPLLERAWAQARIERLLHLRETAHAGDDDLRQALAHEVVDLSIRHRVLSPYTALLVLESESDYARFGLDRHALADILTVGPGGLDVLARRMPAPVPPEPAAAKRDLQSLAYAGRTSANEEPPPADGDVEIAEESAIEDRVGGIPGGVESGVSGGVAGGVAGGVVGGVPAAPQVEPPNQPAEVPEVAQRQLDARTAPAPEAIRDEVIVERPRPLGAQENEKERQLTAPFSGRFGEVMADLAAGRVEPARTRAEAWATEAPGDVLALLALGEVWEAAGEKAAAARAYGSLIDLFPGRADLRRLAGERLERLGDAGLELAIDTYEKAVADRPDHPSGHRLLAWALLRSGRLSEAFAALEKGIEQQYPGGRFAGVDRVLKEDLGLLAAAWLRAEPARRAEVLDRLAAHDARLESDPSLRFILTWETDANDVDLHVWNRDGDHAYYGHRTLSTGGELYADVTTGYGPECFTVRAPEGEDATPYRLAVHYYRRGPMGYGMGTLHVVFHDGEGKLRVEPRPFVVMADDAMVDLGTVGKREPPRRR